MTGFEVKVKALKAGERYAIRNPYAEPEVYKARAARYEEEHGPELAALFREGMMAEYWHPEAFHHVSP